MKNNGKYKKYIKTKQKNVRLSKEKTESHRENSQNLQREIRRLRKKKNLTIEGKKVNIRHIISHGRKYNFFCDAERRFR